MQAAIGGAALLAGVAAAWLASRSQIEASGPIAAVLAVVLGWSFIGSGLVAWRARSENRLGPVMVFIGFAWFATFLADARDPLAFTVGTALENVYLVGFAYLVLAFPSGRLRTHVERVVIGCAIVLATVVEWVWLLFTDSRAIICPVCPRNAFELVRDDALSESLLQGQRMAGILLSLFMLLLLVSRWRRASAPLRHSVAPVLWTGAATFAALAVSVLNDAFQQPLGALPAWVLACVFASIAIAVLAVLLQQRLAHTAVAGLIVELGRRGQGTDVQEALRDALGDRSLELGYWIPDLTRFVRSDGTAIDLPGPRDERVSTVVERDGAPIAALIHDAALRQNVELVESVCAAAGLTLDNEHLHAELHAKLAELQASRARLVEATELERRRIERDLHDGTQQRLVSIAMSLGLAESKLARDPAAAAPVVRRARNELALALEELRNLSQGIHPAILVERGLAAALDELGRRAGLRVRLEISLEERLPDHVEAAAYFLASEALTNAAKHSQAEEARLAAWRADGTLVVEIEDGGIGGAGPANGTGLRGLADRVEALGGKLTVSSPRGGGTLLRAEIPCG